MKRNNKAKGFTLIEIMIVVLIIGILLAIAVPNFVRARASSRLKAIEANLKQIDAAKQQFAMEQGKTSSTAVAQSDLAPTYVPVWPAGPVTGAYDPTTVGTPSTFAANGGTAMDQPTWDSTCAADPSIAACGL